MVAIKSGGRFIKESVEITKGETTRIRIRDKSRPTKPVVASSKEAKIPSKAPSAVSSNPITAKYDPKTEITNSLGMTFVYIPPGSFMMGSPDDEPGRNGDERLHEVTLTKGFYMQSTEVTQGQWKAVMEENPSDFRDCGEDCPVENVSWEDAQHFIQALNQREKTDDYRLPTEAEWEYACRAGTTTPFYFGRCLSTDQGNYDGNYPLEGCAKGKYRERPIPVGSLAANAWGLYDMYGNVREWCQDWYGNYPTGSVTDPVGPKDGAKRVVRSGSWINFAGRCRSANRIFGHPVSRNGRVGLRLVRSSL